MDDFNMGRSKKTTEGGSEWEAGEAWKLIVQARAAGDSETEQLGWLRYKEALVNAAGATAAAVLIVLDGKIDRLIAQTDNADRASLTWRSGLREHLDDRFDNFGGELDELKRMAVDGAARLGKLETGQAAHSEQLNTLSETVNENKDRIDELTERMDEYMAGSRRAEVDELKVQVGELIAERRKYTPEQIQKMTDTLMEMIAERMAAEDDARD